MALPRRVARLVEMPHRLIRRRAAAIKAMMAIPSPAGRWFFLRELVLGATVVKSDKHYFAMHNCIYQCKTFCQTSS